MDDANMAPRYRGSNYLGLLAWLGVTFVAAGLGAVASLDAAAFYAELAKPRWAPPAWLFGPVWTALYVLMGVAAWQVWRRAGWSAGRAALSLYLVQLAANALWSWLFFGWRQGTLALVDVVVLLALVLATVVSFARISRLAAVLLVPYAAWVTFASALTYAVVRANPALLG